MPFFFNGLLTVVAVFAGAVASITGFGIGSMLTLLLALQTGMPLAVAAVSIPHLLATRGSAIVLILGAAMLIAIMIR